MAFVCRVCDENLLRENKLVSHLKRHLKADLVQVIMQSPQTKDGLVDEQEVPPAVQEDAKTYNGSMCNTPVKRRIWARSGDSGGTVESSCGAHNFTGRILLPDGSPDGNMSGGSELASPSRDSLPAVGMLTPPSHKTTLVYICSYCQKTFYSLVSLNAHQDDHLRDQFIEDILAMEKSFAVNYDGMRMFQDFFNAGFKCGQEASGGSFQHEAFYRTFLEKYYGDKSTGSFEDIRL